MKTFLTATLAGISAVILSAPVLLAISLILAGPSHFEKSLPQARGSGRNEDKTLISSASETDETEGEPKRKTDIADKTRSGEAQTTQKESKDPEPHPRRD